MALERKWVPGQGWQTVVADGATPGGSDGELQYNDGGSLAGAAFGKVVDDIPIWGEPGVVDPAAGDDSAGWVALTAQPTYGGVTTGYAGTSYAQVAGRDGQAVLEAGRNDGTGNARLIVTDEYTQVYARPRPGQTEPVFLLWPHTSIGPNGELGFFSAAPVAQPQVPAAPTAQDIVDALVALGLISQAP